MGVLQYETWNVQPCTGQQYRVQRVGQETVPYRYRPTKHTPGLWHHKWQPILFYLVVDNITIEYVGKEQADHLASAIKEHYEISKEWEVTLY